MSYSLAYLKKAHADSFQNEKAVLESEQCGCFHCRSVYPSAEIEEWVDDDDAKTALCPYCAMDSVIADSSGYPITDSQFLKAMYYHYFVK